uniref:GPI inositol-deacylase n=1 Tax=Aegilops tauschii TaxID=37682 RepID=M8CNV4_AEGTA
MAGFGGNCRLGAVLFFSAWITLAALNRLVRPAPNGCQMTYMYPTYIPIHAPNNVSSDRYGLFLYHEGWKEIDFDERVRKLDGVPVLFIPGNGGSYKQVRSFAAESSRAYQNGPLEPSFYREPSSAFELEDSSLPSQYGRILDWFTVDLEGEHSAMDGRILEEHTEYVVYAIHRILDQYKESHLARSKDGVRSTGNLPSSVMLVGHSMGGFVARAALVHPGLRKSAVETILTLSSPHQYPPVALQPSLGHFFSHVNEEWRNGYKKGVSHTSSPKLSNVVVVSISGGIHDYQIRSRLAALDGIVPSTHGFMVLNLQIFLRVIPGKPVRNDTLFCPPSVLWTSDGLEKDLHIQSNLVTVLAMDGRRRWLDIKKLGSNGRGHFVFVTNLAPCSGVRIHLWPEKHRSSIENEVPASKRIVEVTSKMVHIPAGPAPKQVEPGSQTEQPPPSAFLLLSPEDMNGYNFMTISVASRQVFP